MTNKKPFKLPRGCHTFATFFATYKREQKMSSDWPILTKLRCKLPRGCYTQATCLAMLRKVEGRFTFLATRNASIAVANWGVTREFFLATCKATFVALQVTLKQASGRKHFVLLFGTRPHTLFHPFINYVFIV